MNTKVLMLILVLAMVIVMAACGAGDEQPTPTSVVQEPTSVPEPVSDSDMGHGMGPGSGMRARHHATVPEAYAGQSNPISSDQDSLARGADLYSTLCASCHGDGGAGDGPAGATLDPAPAPVAHTSQMLGDDQLFWRISEGGVAAPFNSTMPAWKDSLDEQARWDLINYMRALGRGEVEAQSAAGGAAYDPAIELAARAEMLAAGVEQSIITQSEADLFDTVHSAMDERAASGEGPAVGGMDQMRLGLLAELAELGVITQEQADTFEDVHQRLIDAGLME